MNRFLLALTLPLLVACGGGDTPPPVAPQPPPPPMRLVSDPLPPADPLGGRPATPDPAPFTPPVPTVYKHRSGVTVWLVERHTLPIVSWQLVVPGGAKWDDKAKSGTAWATANMLDEGAGTRGPLDIARDLDRLGATLQTGAVADYSFAQLTVLKKNLGDAAKIFSDVVGKPTFSPVEWTRVKNLWLNDLKQRKSDPSAVARVVLQKRVFGAGHFYAAPVNGTTTSAARVELSDLKASYAENWKLERSTIVVVGDVTREELEPVLDATFPKPPPKGEGTGRGIGANTPESGRRVFLVDRPDAPQSVIAVGRRGVNASSPHAPPLVRVNSALGGSFTSRLNQDLREEHGWSYGAGSRFSWTAQEGIFSAQAAVHTEHTGDALKAMLADIESLAKDGLTEEEVGKTRKLARADLVESFEGVEAAASRLARNAGVGLPANHEADASKLLYGATNADLKKLAGQYLDLANAVIVVVGPKAKVLPQLEKIGITKVEITGPEGE